MYSLGRKKTSGHQTEAEVPVNIGPGVYGTPVRDTERETKTDRYRERY